MDRIVNNIQLVQKLTCMLRTKKKKKNTIKRFDFQNM